MHALVDGLPQKAKFPQEALNEIHGAWFDPSNPVVPMSGSLRGDLFEWLQEWGEEGGFMHSHWNFAVRNEC